MATITYQDKENVNTLPNVPANNKVSDTDMNEIKSVVNANQVQTTSDGDWTIIKFGESSGLAVCFARVQLNNVAITTSGGGEYRSGWTDATNLPTGITLTSLAATPTNGSQGDGTHVMRCQVSGGKAQVIVSSPGSVTRNIPVFLIGIGTW